MPTTIIDSDQLGDVLLTDADDEVLVTSGVLVDGRIDLAGGDVNSLVNGGVISFGGELLTGRGAVESDADQTLVTNNGSIISTAWLTNGEEPFGWGGALAIGNGTLTLTNNETGLISGLRFGIEIAGVYTESGIVASSDTTIVNHGLIEGGDDGIRMHGGTVDNWGTIQSAGDWVIGGGWSAYDGISSFALSTTDEADIAAGLTTINNHEGGVLDGIRAGAMLSGGGHVVNDGLFTGGEAGIGVQGIQPDGSDIQSPFSLVNNGVIEGRGDGSGDGLGLVDTVGVGLFGLIGDASIENNGLIASADDGIFALSSVSIVNGEDGVIEADTDGDGEGYAILLSSLPDEVSSVDDTVVNYGLIDGDVSLGAGDDSFTFGRGGEVNGAVSGGDGADVFVFEKKADGGVISDFEDGVDLIDLSDLPKGHVKHMDVSQEGDDTYITVGKTLIILEDFNAGNISADDFIFG
ncbi:hypothetical protein [Kordiimonas lacus]|uniref:Uncharacterized protein n=1 Tax=Kordiimonas lacus TaxID=637679 RepID=A0A1G7DCI7_9PROT|nr:hypothetical protein [Kordiimonas lacus]SDE49189.1 hypothetical protein SAMN04488071_3046 [Kordiimonas lacus]